MNLPTKAALTQPWMNEQIWGLTEGDWVTLVVKVGLAAVAYLYAQAQGPWTHRDDFSTLETTKGCVCLRHGYLEVETDGSTRELHSIKLGSVY